jgi:hypothetical protein
MRTKHGVLLGALVGLLVPLLPGSLSGQGAASPDQIVASLKQSLAESQKRLRTYQWIETTVISLKGEEKSRKQEEVYYGADGTLTKLPMGPAAQPAAAPSGGRGGHGGRLKANVVENKKDEMKEYMQRASNVQFEGSNVAPRIRRVITDGRRACDEAALGQGQSASSFRRSSSRAICWRLTWTRQAAAW